MQNRRSLGQGRGSLAVWGYLVLADLPGSTIQGDSPREIATELGESHVPVVFLVGRLGWIAPS